MFTKIRIILLRGTGSLFEHICVYTVGMCVCQTVYQKHLQAQLVGMK